MLFSGTKGGAEGAWFVVLFYNLEASRHEPTLDLKRKSETLTSKATEYRDEASETAKAAKTKQKCDHGA